MEIKGQFGKVIFGDSLELMKSIKDNEFELGFTDPFYNIDFKGYTSETIKNLFYKSNRKVIHYKDKMNHEDYLIWCKQWFKELQRITKYQLIYCGNINLSMWYNNFEVESLLPVIKKNSTFGSKIALFAPFYPLIWLGDIPKQKLQTNVIYDERNNSTFQIKNLIHPSPKSWQVAADLFKQLKPKSVIDIFAGSGSTFAACEYLGIYWRGYEIKEEYSSDIQKHILLGIRRRNQLNIKKLGDY